MKILNKFELGLSCLKLDLSQTKMKFETKKLNRNPTQILKVIV